MYAPECTQLRCRCRNILLRARARIHVLYLSESLLFQFNSNSESVLHFPDLAQVRGGRCPLPEPRASLYRRFLRSHEGIGGELFRDCGWYGVFALAQALQCESNFSLQGFVVRVDALGEAVVARRVLEQRGLTSERGLERERER